MGAKIITGFSKNDSYMLRFLTSMLKIMNNGLSHRSDIQPATCTDNLPGNIGTQI